MLIAKVARSAPDLHGMSLAHLLARTEEDRHAQISQCSNGVGCCPARRVRTGDNFGAAFRQTNVLHIQRAREAARAYAATGQVLVPSRRSRDWWPSGTGAECRRKDALWHVLRDSGGTAGSRASTGSQIHRDTRRYTTSHQG